MKSPKKVRKKQNKNWKNRPSKGLSSQAKGLWAPTLEIAEANYFGELDAAVLCCAGVGGVPLGADPWPDDARA